MKKVKKLVLTRETLRTLRGEEAAHAAAAGNTPFTAYTCLADTCVGSCPCATNEVYGC